MGWTAVVTPIRADTKFGTTVGSVTVRPDGGKGAAPNRTENKAPYSLYGDDNTGENSALNGETLPAGAYTASATAYAERNAAGAVLGTRSVAFTLVSPPSVSVADAEIEEGENARLAYDVTLDRAPKAAASVDYAAADGTATAGENYTATSGTSTSPSARRRRPCTSPSSTTATTRATRLGTISSGS